MMNYRLLGLAGAACLLTMITVAQAKAIMIAPPPAGQRVATADLIVVGKVTGFGEKTVKGEMYKGDERQMQIATIKVGETLVGKADKEIKVGFFPPKQPEPQKDGIRLPIRRYPTVQLKQDEEYCLFLTKHPTQKGVYVAVNYYDAIGKKDNTNFAKEVEEIKKAAKLLEKPIDGLKSKAAEDRLLTAGLLISRYRTQRGDGQKTEQIDAEESKLILQTLAEADWQPKNVRFGTMTAQALFFQLGLTPDDGWQQPKDFTKLADEAKKWCKDNAGKYRIKRFVSDSKAKDDSEPKK